MTGFKRHVSFTEIIPTAYGFAKALGLAFDVKDSHSLNVYLEHQLHGGLDLKFGSVLQDLESHSIGFSAIIVAFSDTMGVTNTCINRPSSNLILGEEGLRMLMRTSP